jgi:Putative peptidoglycan binding domain
MKRILALTFCLGLGLAQIVHGENSDKNKKKKTTNAAAVHANQHNAQVQRNAQVQHKLQFQQNMNAPRSGQRHHTELQQEHNAAAVNAQVKTRKVNRKQPNMIVSNQSNNRVVHQNNNVVIRNRNSFVEASRRFNWHERHDRDWWRNHWGHTRFVIFGGGYYFWNSGYWYPAYGYDPAYSTYQFDEPIYGYNELPPGQVITNVQVQLQREGYYNGEIDGLIGPATRSALARYQADHGLLVTRAVDEPTLEMLGLA